MLPQALLDSRKHMHFIHPLNRHSMTRRHTADHRLQTTPSVTISYSKNFVGEVTRSEVTRKRSSLQTNLSRSGGVRTRTILSPNLLSIERVNILSSVLVVSSHVAA